MNLNKYPRIVSHKKYKGHPNGFPKCELCEQKAVYRATIQTSWMRGDDEYRPRCENHKDTATKKQPTKEQL